MQAEVILIDVWGEGGVKGRVSLEYRGWTFDPDTWVALTPGVFHYPAGFWHNSPVSAVLESYDSKKTDPNCELWLQGLPREIAHIGHHFRKGRGGHGLKWTAGGTMPYGDIKWECVDIKLKGS
jgi:hypothetical protein